MTTYYVSNSGDDAKSGTTPVSAWRTLSRIKSQRLRPGDEVLLRRGDTFYENLDIDAYRANAQSLVSVGAYGDGERPKVSLYKSVKPTAWVEHSANVWKVNINDNTNISGFFDAGVHGANVGFLKVNGKIYGAKYWSVGELSSDWDFYSDRVSGNLYVYSQVSPEIAAGEVLAAVGQVIVSSSAGVTYSNLDLVGCAGHGIGGVLTDVRMFGCVIREIGGGQLASTPSGNTTRYGNGIEVWTGSSNCVFYGNTIADVYDVATTMQGSNTSVGWRDVWFKNNLIIRCNQSFEAWCLLVSSPTPDAGFIRTGFVGNICIDAGYGWSSDVRPDSNVGCHILFYDMNGFVNDIAIDNNKFYNAKDSLIFSSAGGIAPGISLNGNAIFMRDGQKISFTDSFTAEQWADFADAYNTGHTSIVETLSTSTDLTVQEAIRKVSSVVGGNASEASITTSAIGSLYGLIGQLQSSHHAMVESLSSYYTFTGPTTGLDQFAKLADITLTNLGRFDSVWLVHIGGDSDQNRNSVGVLSIQIVPSATPGGTYVDMDMAELLPFRGGTGWLSTADFHAVVTDESATSITVTILANIGKDAYSRVVFRSLSQLAGSNARVVMYTQGDRYATLPAGPAKAARTADSVPQRPVVGSAAPASAPLFVGQFFVDMVAKKTYVGMGTASPTDWVLMN